jgi:LmbE family N-acetylglucosaminyl deacetylase
MRASLPQRIRTRCRRLLARGSSRAPYRFLVRRWDGISDVDLAVRVLGTEFFANSLAPSPLPVSNLRRLVVLAPHQDDEVIGPGGSLILARNAGARIDLVFLTDGAPKAGRIKYAATPAEAVRVRFEEAGEVAGRLGAAVHRLDLSNTAFEPGLEHVNQLAKIIKDCAPEVILAPWLLDSPAKHRAVHHLLWAVSRVSGLPECELWGYQVHNTLYPNGYVEITDVAEEKRQLIELYRSQLESDLCYDHVTLGVNAWNAKLLRATRRAYVELFFAVPLRENVALVERFYFRDLRATYRDHPEVLPGMARFHHRMLRQSRSE